MCSMYMAYDIYREYIYVVCMCSMCMTYDACIGYVYYIYTTCTYVHRIYMMCV